MNEIWKQLFETSESVRNFYERNISRKPKRELTISQLRVMSCIFFNDSGVMRIKDISEELGITAGGISQSVDVLVNAGLLTRCKDEHDRRAVAVALSEYGLKVRAEVYEEFEQMFMPFLDGVTEEEKESFANVLGKILSNVKKENIKR
ncbi:MAG: MarR family transcriptional regulator [Lentisphaeria bacterium]|nr:MarR family transcriptional regulator [Lentisphaeria bacterium]